MQNEEVKVLKVNVTPVSNASPSLQQSMQETAQVMQDALNSFETETKEEKEAKGFLHTVKDYIKSDAFKSDVAEVSKKYNVPPKKVAQNFFEKALGTVGDILGIGISVVCNAGRMIINLASTVCHGIINLIQSIANGLASIVTFNKTCVA